MAKNAFAIVHTWPDIKNAEYEVIHRIIKAAENVGLSIVVIDNNGYPLWSSPSLAVDPNYILDGDAIDFLISLHFESPKTIDAYSYYTVWQPLEFYHTFGYQKSIDKMTSHNDLVSADSDLADAHALNLLSSLGREPLLPLPKMFHAIPEPFLEPSISETSTLFYIGINWERIGKPKGRFHDTLVALDKLKLIDIYGPELFLGVAPWEGFETYRGELPFDGESIKGAINRSGICLALSSAAHKHAGIMSTRLFEGLAGGAAIIATPNALIDKHFKHVVYEVDDSQGEIALGRAITAVLRKIRASPSEARERVLEGQRIFREVCSLENSLKALAAETPTRVAHFNERFLRSANVSVLLTFYGQSLPDFRDSVSGIARQREVSIELHLICDEGFAVRNEREIHAMATGAIRSLHVHTGCLHPIPGTFDGSVSQRDRTGPIVAEVIKQLQTPYFCFVRNGETLFRDHMASIVKAIIDSPGCVFGCSGMIEQTTGSNGKLARTIQGARFADFETILHAKGTNQQGRFLFKTNLCEAPVGHLLEILDGEEHSYFQLAGLLAGPLAQTNYTTYIRDPVKAALIPDSVELIEHQRQYIRDFFARDSRWLDRISRDGRPPEFVYAYGPGAPIRWENYTAPVGATHRLRTNQMMPVGLGKDGLKFLGSGFSFAEEGHVWLEAQTGTIIFVLDGDLDPDDEELELVLYVSGRPSLATGRDQHCTLAINGMVVAYERVPSQRTMLRFVVPYNLRTKFEMYRVEITPDHSDMVYDHNGVMVDNRRLSIQLVEFGAFRGIQADYPILEAEKVYRFGTSSITAAVTPQGFYPSESGFVWMAGTKGYIRFKFTEVLKAPVIMLGVTGRTSLQSREPQKIRIFLNGQFLGEYIVPDKGTTIRVELPIDQIKRDLGSGASFINLRIEASHAEAVFDKSHTIVDNRLLGVQLRSIGIFDKVREHPNRLKQEQPLDDHDNWRWRGPRHGAAKRIKKLFGRSGGAVK